MHLPDFKGAKEYALELAEDLEEDIIYHSKPHWLDVEQAAIRLADRGGLSEGQTVLLRTAAIYHDTGFVKQYEKHETESARMVSDALPKFRYTENQVRAVIEMILASKIPQKPVNRLQEMMSDADLDQLGREDFFEKAELLRQELKLHDRDFEPKEWYMFNLEFLEAHVYFTPEARSLRSAGKEKNKLEVLRLLGYTPAERIPKPMPAAGQENERPTP